MGKLNLTFACGDYDRIAPLSTKRVQPEGIELNFIPLQPEELFWRAIQFREFEVCEFSLGAYYILQDRGDDRFVAIPVFPSREFRHSAIYINKHAGIKKPEDFKGKRIGVPDYTMTASVWIRGFLKDDYGISPTDVHWYTGGLNSPGRKQRISVRLPDDLNVSYIGDNKTLSEMLAEGEIDALIGSREPQSFHTNPSNVTRLWPNYAEVEEDYFKRTNIFPIMHVIVIKGDILEKYPWIAQSLFKAFCEAKDICQREINALSASKYMIPWYRATYEKVLDIMGTDYWAYGIENNYSILDAFARYCFDQGLTEKIIKPDDIFASSTLKPYVI